MRALLTALRHTPPGHPRPILNKPRLRAMATPPSMQDDAKEAMGDQIGTQSGTPAGATQEHPIERDPHQEHDDGGAGYQAEGVREAQGRTLHEGFDIAEQAIKQEPPPKAT